MINRKVFKPDVVVVIGENLNNEEIEAIEQFEAELEVMINEMRNHCDC